MNGGQIIAKVLQNHGVKFLFTLCGGHISPIFVGAEQLGIRVIDTRHEVNAVFAADAVSRLSGVPGVAAVTAGPGVTNTITAIKNAALAQSPLILLGGTAATILKGRGSLQDIDQISILKSVCKQCISIHKVKEIVPAIEQAFRLAQSGVPGPVFVECPIDILYDEELVRNWYGAKSNETPPKNLRERALRWYINFHANRLFAGKETVKFNSPPIKPEITATNPNDIAAAERLLKKSKKPLLITGSGAMMQPQKSQELADSVKKLGIPVYLSGMARGLLGKEDSLQMRHKRKEAIKAADLIILAGVPNDFRLDYGNHIGGRTFISINRSKEDLYKNKKPTLAIEADPAETLISLASKYTAERTSWIDELRQLNQKRDDEIISQANETLNGGINPLALFHDLDDTLGDNTIFVADGGDFVGTAAYTLRPRAPLSWLDPGVFGTLGVGAGFALGAKLVFPEKDVWIIYGDGSAGFSLMEYDTFARHNLPVVSVIGNDACWGQIARDQVEFLKSDCAMNLAHSHYELIAKAFGGDGMRVHNMEEWRDAVSKAKENISDGKPYIINSILGKSDFRKGSISV